MPPQRKRKTIILHYTSPDFCIFPNFYLKSGLMKHSFILIYPPPRKVLLFVSKVKCLNFKTLEYRANILSTWKN